ncbi:uncharacterized protein N7515_001722 [Penicillium bovifimosum]|uniref:Uncharacterized protein n=1 Tax=Penicillium bovifimosum TaxID=126998 RepID=A0A9W9L7D7_9EURO|nr:uncharacterized protein N7515_001722 [Penicillium bovifimosum]KAJ5142935.1 hypothetical protein N7515_001722 [Penicillium bovifimosum]
MGDASISQAIVPEESSRMILSRDETPRRLVQPRLTPTDQEAEAIIDRAYASGKPFFTKRAIQDLWDQIKREPVRGSEIFIKDITGALVACEVQTGHIDDWEDWVELQKRDHREKVLCYSQDPAYTEVDKQLLAESGIEVTLSPVSKRPLKASPPQSSQTT